MATRERESDLVHAEQGLYTPADQCSGELREDAAQYRAVVRPVGGAPRAMQKVRIELHVRDLQQRELFLAAPVAVALCLVTAGGHTAEGDGQAFHGAIEPES
ncbi:hypothetical protein [Streptomyces spiralis]